MKRRDWDLPTLVAALRRTATRAGRRRSGRFSLEGDRLHERALRAGAPLEAVLVSRSYRDDRAPRRRALLREIAARGIPALVVEHEAIAEFTEGREIGAIVGLCSIPRPRPSREIFGHAAAPRIAVLVACEIEEPGNVGALVRTSLACGSPALLAVGKSDPFHPKAVRTSMGAVFRIPILPYADVDRLLDDLDRHGVEPIAAVSHGGTPLPRCALTSRAVAFVVGSESGGLSEELLRRVATTVTVPMIDEVDSLSVNAAAAVLLYEVGRRRGGPVPPCAGPEGAVG